LTLLIAALQTQLAALHAMHMVRQRSVVQALHGSHLQIGGQNLLAFCSNDYLALAGHPALIAAAQAAAAQYGVGASASALVCGHSAAHEALEQELATFVGLPRALYFGSGYLANVGSIPALVGRGDAVFSDALNHACLIDGIRLSGAQTYIYPHLDLITLEQQLFTSCAERKLIVTDAVFSMDGSLAPVPELVALCEQHDAYLFIDDAHGFGVLGTQGQGSMAHWGLASTQAPSSRLIYMATLGKAAGNAGAFVAGHASIIEWLMQRARSYIFATAPSAMLAQVARTSLQLMTAEPWRRQHLMALIAYWHNGLRQRDLGGLTAHHALLPTAIQPLILGGNQAALAAMQYLKAQGFWVPAIRPPTVPLGTARLRVCLSAAHSFEHVDALLDALQSHDVGHPK
jgi:8-amino-7-oxononanoate synthase